MNKVVLIGRLTRDPEFKSFGNGGGVTKLGLAVNNRKKDATGQWVDDPMFIDVEVFDRGQTGKQASNARNNLAKGHRIAVEGKLVLDQWDDKKSGQKRTKHKIVADYIEYIDRNSKDEAAGNRRQADEGQLYGGGEEAPAAGQGEEIPF